MMKYMLNAKGRRKSDDQLQQELLLVVGPGPMRFGPVRQALTIREELAGLSRRKVECFANVKAEYEMTSSRKDGVYTDLEMLRIVQFVNYDENRALRFMFRNKKPRHFQLNAFDLEEQLLSKTLFPVPGLKTLQPCNDVFYMRPSRYCPRTTPTSMIIDNLIYVMDHMTFKNNNEVAFIANMKDWKMSNFSTDYCLKFMQVLQGKRFPAKVNLVLIVNPPSWFGKVWKVMKPMLSKSFRSKVHFTNEDELWSFLKVGYEEYLPDEFIEGQASTDDIVNDFVKYRKNLEVATRPDLKAKNRRRGVLASKKGKGQTKGRFRLSPWPRRTTFAGEVEDVSEETDADETVYSSKLSGLW